MTFAKLAFGDTTSLTTKVCSSSSALFVMLVNIFCTILQMLAHVIVNIRICASFFMNNQYLRV